MRAGKTFVQAFVAVVPVSSVVAALRDADWTMMSSLAVAGFSAGAAALFAVAWNLLLQWSEEK